MTAQYTLDQLVDRLHPERNIQLHIASEEKTVAELTLVAVKVSYTAIAQAVHVWIVSIEQACRELPVQRN